MPLGTVDWAHLVHARKFLCCLYGVLWFTVWSFALFAIVFLSNINEV